MWIVIWTMEFCDPLHKLYPMEEEARKWYNKLRSDMQTSPSIRRIEIGEIQYKDAFDRRRIEREGMP